MYSSLRTFQLEHYQMNNLILYKYNNMKRNKKQGIEKNSCKCKNGNFAFRYTPIVAELSSRFKPADKASICWYL